MPNEITVVDVTIPVVEYQGQRVVTLAMVDKLHHRPEGTARKRFSDNRDRFMEGKHFHVIDYSQLSVFRTFGIEVPPRGLIVLTERGYSMLVKSFTDDFAWDVQEQIVDGYFENKKPLSTAEFLVQQAQLILEHEQRLKRLEDGQERMTEHVLDAKREAREASDTAVQAFEAASAALTHKFGEAGFFTIMAFAKARGLRIGLHEAKIRGARASQLSRDQDVKIIRVPDERYGNVNSYHESVLNKVFKDLL